MSFVDPADDRWCVARIVADRIEDLKPKNARMLFQAAPLGLEGVKDPWIFVEGTSFRMVLSVALTTGATSEKSHATADIFNTGECISATAMALSRDLDGWEWHGVIFSPENTGWDAYCRRLNSAIAFEGKYLGFYDGSSGHAENYEEKSGLAVSRDFKQWQTLSPSKPWLTSVHGSGSLRYLQAVAMGEQTLLFYEVARPDGSHELQMSRQSSSGMAKELHEH